MLDIVSIARVLHEAPEWQPLVPPHGARCSYCHTLALSGAPQ